MVILLAAAVLGGAKVVQWERDEPLVASPEMTTADAEAAPLAYENVKGKYLFSGTIVLARAVELLARNSSGQKDFGQPFSRLDSFEREKYDAWSTDFECPITDNVVPYQTQIDSLVFNCRPEFLPELTKYFNLFNLANNHSDNQGGQTGIASTRAYFEQYGVQYYGNYDPELTDEICEVIALPVRLQKKDGGEDKASLPVAFCAWHYFNYNRGPTAAELAVATEYAKVMPVFGFVEMGIEYVPKATEAQRVIARQIIDAGADFVFANNPHWVQDSEAYNGKLIVYSLGNFIFDQLDSETQRGVSIDTEITSAYDSNMEQWIALGAECKRFQDECLDKAVAQKLKKIELAFTYAPIANVNGYRLVTHKADPAVQAAVEERLQWANTMRALGQGE